MLEELTLKGCIEFAITTEAYGAEHYARLAEKFSQDPEITKIFSRLSEDELVHKQQFTELLAKSLQAGAKDPPPEKSDYLKAMSYSAFFSPYQGPFKDIDAVEGRNDALQRALEFEKATLGFYKAFEDVNGSSDLLTKIIDAEKNHIIVVMKALLVDGSKFRSLQDSWS
ncbi:MAG: ferritin family protein [Acidobacteriota bacterium]|jgi:rubrerythrin